MKILIACESSGTVREAFRARGHDAWSCDLLPADDDSPYHIQADARDVGGEWDMMGFHPPCTYVSVSGMHWTSRGLRDPKLTEDALELVRWCMSHKCPWYLENPVSIISTRIRKPDQTIQPYQFGEDASKRTCLWLHNLPLLIPTNITPAAWSTGLSGGEIRPTMGKTASRRRRRGGNNEARHTPESPRPWPTSGAKSNNSPFLSNPTKHHAENQPIRRHTSHCPSQRDIPKNAARRI